MRIWHTEHAHAFYMAAVQGNCTSEPSNTALGISGSPLAERKANQCIIVTDIQLGRIAQNLWMDNLYFRHQYTAREPHLSIFRCIFTQCNLWMTDVTFQGNGVQDPEHGALVVEGSQLYGQGVGTMDTIVNIMALRPHKRVHEPHPGCREVHISFSSAYFRECCKRKWKPLCIAVTSP